MNELPKNPSESFRRRNPHLYTEGSRQDSKLELFVGPVPLGTPPGESSPTGPVRIRFISVRKRLCDPDNLSVKWLLDCLRYCGAIAGDEPEKIILETGQRKAEKGEDEHTLIQIYET